MAEFPVSLVCNLMNSRFAVLNSSSTVVDYFISLNRAFAEVPNLHHVPDENSIVGSAGGKRRNWWRDGLSSWPFILLSALKTLPNTLRTHPSYAMISAPGRLAIL
jgi:hypothetical protein